MSETIPGGFYAELTARNAGVIDQVTQETLRRASVLIAGCGSIGGAAAEPLARLGIQRFTVADPGDYELNNLNRQHAAVTDIGRNKAEAAAERIRNVNPHCQVRVFRRGVTTAALPDLIKTCDVVVDGVDVTTAPGLRAKYLLHEETAHRGLPLITGWDMAGAQYVRYYDYRKLSQPFGGKITRPDLDRLGTWELLRRMVPARYVPLEMLAVATANYSNPGFSFPQLVYAADLFGALAAHIVTQLLTHQPVRTHIYLDLHQAARPAVPRWRTRFYRPLKAAGAIAALRRPATT